MPIVLFIEKNGTVKEMLLKEIVPEELYRKASFKTAEGFGVQATWTKENMYNVQLYARKNGRAGSENKYDFPPPVDSELFFGGCILTNKNSDGGFADLTKSMWEKIYEELFGGFDDIESEDSDDEDESSEEDIPRTKEGYAKDGFIVDDAEVDESESESESEEEESDVEGEVDIDIDIDGEDDLNTEDLCEDDSDSDLDSDTSDSDSDLDDDEDSDDYYNSDGSGGGITKEKKKKPIKKPVSVNQKNTKKTAVVAAAPISAVKPKRRSAPVVNTRSKTKPSGNENTDTNGSNTGGYLNCSNELEEEAYLED